MAQNEFGGMLYPTRAAMLAAVAEDFITAQGRNAQDEVARACTRGAAALVDECIEGWGLDQPRDSDESSWMDRQGVARDELVEAFDAWIATEAAAYGADDSGDAP
jgi:hypothetical protein